MQGEGRAQGQPYEQPPLIHRADGGSRRVGVEIEFGGLRPDAITQAVRSALGGEIRRRSQVAYDIEGTVVGDIELELDFRLLQRAAEEHEQLADLPEWLLEVSSWTAELLERLVSQVVPWEIVTGPVPMADLHKLEPMVTALRKAGALGTRHAPYFAFGVHLNPELPDLEADTLCRYFKAYLCLKDWLRQRSRLDLSRVLSPYISDFDDRYVGKVVAPAYQPEMAELIDDYLEANPTRNRSLDMLPVFAEVDRDRVLAVVDDPLIKARPTLHYRLPNCEIDDPQWHLQGLWNDWLEVERLAFDPERLQAMGKAYGRWLSALRVPFDEGWARATADWL